LELLEGKALLSQVVPHHPVHLARVTPSLNRPVTIKTNQLQGMVTGTYAIAPSTPAPGMSYNLNGSGQVGTLGVVKVAGFIHIGTSPKSAPTGMITLSDDKGSIQLAVTGKGGPRPLAPVGSGSMSLHYTIVSGTGAFRNYHGSGSVNMATMPITPVVPPPVPPPITTPPVGAGGGSATTPPDTNPPVTPPPVTTPPVTLPPVTPPPVTTPPTTLPPTPVPPPTPLPPTPFPPGGAGGRSPGQNSITGAVGANARSQLHKNAHAIKAMALTGKPVGAPTFLHGSFVLTFNGGGSTLPPML
jgi:hypothetical protein